MATLSSSSTVSIGAGSAVVDSISIPILPASVAPGGPGRLIHPTLGTLDYDYPPDEWVNVDVGGVIVPPVWTTAKTLFGAATALWPGNIRDVECQELWTQQLNLKPAFMRQLLAFFQTPPDPDLGTPVQWWPNYVTAHGFNVALQEVLIEGDKHTGAGIALNFDTLIRNWVSGAVTIRMRILSQIS